MITFEDVLKPDDVILALEAKTKGEAIQELLEHLRTDPRVNNWATLQAKIREREKNCSTTLEFGICIPHARTESVSGMVMAVGRFKEPVVTPDATLNYVILIAIPTAMASDYLVLVGSLARIFSAPNTRADLDSAASSDDFCDKLNQASHEL